MSSSGVHSLILYLRQKDTILRFLSTLFISNQFVLSCQSTHFESSYSKSTNHTSDSSEAERSPGFPKRNRIIVSTFFNEFEVIEVWWKRIELLRMPTLFLKTLHYEFDETNLPLYTSNKDRIYSIKENETRSRK